MSLSFRLREYVRLTRIDRPIGIYLLLWPMMWALWIAGGGHPDSLVLMVFLVGSVLMRSAGCVINDYADRHFDPHVERTRLRPLAAGTVTPKEALVLFAVLSLLAFALVLLMNLLTILLAIPAVLLAASYPFMKRYTYLPQAYLGIAFGWAIPMAFAAHSGEVPQAAWLIFFTAVIWALVYDSMYAITDREYDLKIGVKSSAILFGRYDRLIIGLLQIVVLALLVLVGLSFSLGHYYYLGLAAATIFSVYEQYLIRDRDPQLSFRAFLNNHYFGLTVFIGIVVDYLLK